MIEEHDFETYLYISKIKFQIFIFDKKKLQNIYSEELKINNNFSFKDLNDLSKFLDKNIYKIEKLVGNFIKNIILIIENDQIFYLDIGVKKKNYEKFISQKYFENSLIELKDLFKENYQEYRIMHMVILNYIVNGKKYSSFITDLKGDHLCFEVNFITISNNLVLMLNKVLEKYQIKVSQYMCANYIKNFFDDGNIELSEMAFKLKNGLNLNEVVLIPKNIENKGFFEKFFQLFS